MEARNRRPEARRGDVLAKSRRRKERNRGFISLLINRRSAEFWEWIHHRDKEAQRIF